MHTPERGFYYHYKHDGAKGPTDYAYEVLGTALHTEDESLLVLYRPLYESEYAAYARPLTMFMETVEKEVNTIPRFSRITDPELIAKLTQIRDTMYS
jgi:hypothetical protein